MDEFLRLKDMFEAFYVKIFGQQPLMPFIKLAKHKKTKTTLIILIQKMQIYGVMANNKYMYHKCVTIKIFIPRKFFNDAIKERYF